MIGEEATAEFVVAETSQEALQKLKERNRNKAEKGVSYTYGDPKRDKKSQNRWAIPVYKRTEK
jgi:hypothetical protein